MTVAIVRMLIPDPELYDRSEGTANGSDLEWQVPHYPVKVASYKVYVAGALKADGVDYTFDLECGVITFTLAPGIAEAVKVTYKHTVLSDTNISAYLTLEADDVRLAAADALDAIASNEVLVQKVIRLGDLSTNGAAQASALREHAKQLRDTVAAAGDEASFDIAEQVLDQFSYREFVQKDAMRNG